jgi:hypothetical protein
VAYLTNSIGAYDFVSISGKIFYRQQQIEVFNRPGVTGSGLRRLGERGQPFELTTKQFHADFAAAKTAIGLYLALIGGTLPSLTRHGVDHGDYAVLTVTDLTEPVLNPTGNATSSHTVMQTCVWKLLG